MPDETTRKPKATDSPAITPAEPSADRPMVVEPGGPPGVLQEPQNLHPTVAFVLMVILAGFMFMTPYIIAPSDPLAFASLNPVSRAIGAQIFICSSLSIAFGAVTLVGGVCALRRERYHLALLGAVLGMISVGFCGVNAVLGLLAVALVFGSRSQFRS